MFEINGVIYTVKFNKKKIKTVELVTKTSITAEIAQNNGMLRYQTLETLFSLALVEEATNEVVKQNKAIEIFDKLVEVNGLLTTNKAVVEKFQEDMGFMFR